jgi:hypothetical protein
VLRIRFCAIYGAYGSNGPGSVAVFPSDFILGAMLPPHIK